MSASKNNFQFSTVQTNRIKPPSRQENPKKTWRPWRLGGKNSIAIVVVENANACKKIKLRLSRKDSRVFPSRLCDLALRISFGKSAICTRVQYMKEIPRRSDRDERPLNFVCYTSYRTLDFSKTAFSPKFS
ncbi:MAG: hypothetical protein DPW15_15420 [Chloroflexi bacterium]|nr:hypothetical protein [Chloroflexota bacterium]